jgi:hypothetical protein
VFTDLHSLAYSANVVDLSGGSQAGTPRHDCHCPSGSRAQARNEPVDAT